jgi:hypothetical protein
MRTGCPDGRLVQFLLELSPAEQAGLQRVLHDTKTVFYLLDGISVVEAAARGPKAAISIFQYLNPQVA